MEKRYPFKFLDAYTRDDKDFYFGRDEEISLMYNMIFQTNLLLVYGGSGTGKSSLIHCGLASRFDTHDWQAIFVRRGDDINDSLDAALVGAGGEIDENDELGWLDQDWNSMDSDGEKPEKPLLSKRIEAIHLKNFKPIYLIFDQFEELFIFGTDEERSTFYQNIKSLITTEQQLKVIFLIREEYFGHLYDFERVLPQLLRKKIRVEPMNLDKVSEIIMGLSRTQNLLVTIKAGEEQQFAKQVFDRLKGGENRISIELPYLQVFFDKLYISITHDETRTTPAEFSLASLENIGDIGDILRNMLEEQVSEVVNKLNLPADAVWKFLSSFVSLEGTKDPKKLGEILEEFANDKEIPVRRLLNEFVSRRILRKFQGDYEYEIAHDSLAKQISLKRSDDEIALLEMKRLVHGMASLKEDSREYFSEKQLVLITPMLEKLHLNAEEQRWVDASIEHVRKIHEEEENKRNEELRRTKKWLKSAAALLCVILVALTFAGIQTFKASRAKQKSEIFLADNQRMFGFFLFTQPDSIERAKDVFKKITETQVARAEDYGYLGTCYYYLGKRDSALVLYQKSLDVSKKRKRPEDILKDSDATLLKTKALTPAQASAEAHRLLAHYYFGEEDFEQAYDHACQASNIVPGDYDVWLDVSHYAIYAQKYDESINAAQKALKLKGDRKEVMRYLALADALNGDLQASKAIYDNYFNTIFRGPSSEYSKNPLLQFDTSWRYSTLFFFEDLNYAKAHLKSARNLDFVENLLNEKLQEFISEIEMVDVKGGTFTMGSANDPNAVLHKVTLSDYAIGKYEVTQELWETVMGYNPCDSVDFKGDAKPVVNITWEEANTFVQRLSVITHLNFRMPTEAEWEFAAMGGNFTHHYTYSGSNDLRGRANYKSKTKADLNHTVDVTCYEPNELGLYNMSGNVWEWCSDWYGVYGDTFKPSSTDSVWNPNVPIVNPTGKKNPSEFDDKVLRGGSYDSEIGRCAVKNRHRHHPSMRGTYYGLRLAEGK